MPRWRCACRSRATCRWRRRLASDGGGESAWRALFKPKPFAGERLVQFTQQLATLLGAGQPLDRALTILLELPEDEVARRTITDIRDAVRGGASLSTALERQHGAFSRLYVNMVRAGEAGGSLHETLQRLADYLERSQRAARPRDQRADLSGDPAGDGGLRAAVPAGLRGAAVRADVREPGCGAAVVHPASCSALGLFVRDWWSCCWCCCRRCCCGGSTASAAIRCSATRFDAWLLQTQADRPAGGQARNRAPGAHAGHAC